MNVVTNYLEKHVTRVLGLLTLFMGLLYFPFVMEILWNFDSSGIGSPWCLIQVLFGITLCSKDLIRFRNPMLLANFTYQLIWSLLILNHILVIEIDLEEFFPYLLHIVLAIGSGSCYLKFRKLSLDSRNPTNSK